MVLQVFLMTDIIFQTSNFSIKILPPTVSRKGGEK